MLRQVFLRVMTYGVTCIRKLFLHIVAFLFIEVPYEISYIQRNDIFHTSMNLARKKQCINSDDSVFNENVHSQIIVRLQ